MLASLARLVRISNCENQKRNLIIRKWGKETERDFVKYKTLWKPEVYTHRTKEHTHFFLKSEVKSDRTSLVLGPFELSDLFLFAKCHNNERKKQTVPL